MCFYVDRIIDRMFLLAGKIYMKRIRKDIEISDLFYRYLRGEITVDEKELLEAWCLESRNRELFMEFQEADILYEGIVDMNNVDTEVPFKRVNDRIRRRKRTRAMRYFSGVAVAMLVGIVMIFWGEKEKEKQNGTNGAGSEEKEQVRRVAEKAGRGDCQGRFCVRA